MSLTKYSTSSEKNFSNDGFSLVSGILDAIPAICL